jgi:hypothetical protein
LQRFQGREERLQLLRSCSWVGDAKELIQTPFRSLDTGSRVDIREGGGRDRGPVGKGVEIEEA